MFWTKWLIGKLQKKNWLYYHESIKWITLYFSKYIIRLNKSIAYVNLLLFTVIIIRRGISLVIDDGKDNNFWYCLKQ